MEVTTAFLLNNTPDIRDNATDGIRVTATLPQENFANTGMTDGMPIMMKNYTALIEPQLSTAFMAFYFTMRFLFSGFAIFGNVLTITAVFRFKRLRTNTNFLICSLAIADLLGAMSSPLALAHHILSDKPAYVPVCLIAMILILISVGANMLSILGIAVDRYLFIAHGLHYPLWVTSTRTYSILAFTWLFLITEASAITLSLHHLDIGVPCKFYFSFPKQVARIFIMPQMYLLAIFTVVFYVAIGRIAHKQGRAIAALQQPFDTYEASLNRQHKKIAKMMGIVLGTYFICYIPRISAIIILDSSRHISWLYFEKVAIIIYRANNWLNPMIYAWKDKDYRVAFQKLLGMKPSNVSNSP